MQLLDLLEHKSIFTAGYKAILHIHSLVEECEITSLISALDMKTKPPTPKKVSHTHIYSIRHIVQALLADSSVFEYHAQHHAQHQGWNANVM